MVQPPTNNAMVSIRMPKTMFQDLQKLSEKNHFLDVSEQVRSIVRKKWNEAKDPTSYQIKKLRREIADAVKVAGNSKAQSQLVHELEKIKQSLVGDND